MAAAERVIEQLVGHVVLLPEEPHQVEAVKLAHVPQVVVWVDDLCVFRGGRASERASDAAAAARRRASVTRRHERPTRSSEGEREGEVTPRVPNRFTTHAWKSLRERHGNPHGTVRGANAHAKGKAKARRETEIW